MHVRETRAKKRGRRAGGPLASFARGTLDGDQKGVLTLASLDDAQGPESLLQTLARLWALGVDLDPSAIAAPASVTSVPPTVHPREIYWAIKEAPQRRLRLDAVAERPAETEAAPEEAPAPAPVAEADDTTARVLAVRAGGAEHPRGTRLRWRAGRLAGCR